MNVLILVPVTIIVIENDLTLAQVNILINTVDRRNTRATVGVVFVADDVDK
jgi:hypothetical protein